MTPAVISAVFSDFKLVKTRGMAQLVFELPSEFGKSALDALGGLPSPGAEVHVAIARLKEPPNQKDTTMDDVAADERTQEEIAREAVTIAGICANEPPFQEWILGERFKKDDRTMNQVAAAKEIRVQLGVDSRREIRTDPEKLLEWQALYARYQSHLAARKP